MNFSRLLSQPKLNGISSLFSITPKELRRKSTATRHNILEVTGWARLKEKEVYRESCLFIMKERKIYVIKMSDRDKK